MKYLLLQNPQLYDMKVNDGMIQHIHSHLPTHSLTHSLAGKKPLDFLNDTRKDAIEAWFKSDLSPEAKKKQLDEEIDKAKVAVGKVNPLHVE